MESKRLAACAAVLSAWSGALPAQQFPGMADVLGGPFELVPMTTEGACLTGDPIACTVVPSTADSLPLSNAYAGASVPAAVVGTPGAVPAVEAWGGASTLDWPMRLPTPPGEPSEPFAN